MKQTLYKTKHAKHTHFLVNTLKKTTDKTLFLQNALNTAYAHFEKQKEEAQKANNTERAKAFEEAQLVLYLLTRGE